MGFSGYTSYQRAPCPVCGKVGGAFMGKSAWSYGGLACSDTCGEAASAAIDQVRNSPPYEKALERRRKAEETLARLESKAIAAAIRNGGKQP